MKNLYKNKKLIIGIAILCFLCFLNINFAFAQTEAEWYNKAGSAISNGVGQAVAIVLGFIALVINFFVGLLITLIVKMVVTVANFNNIINVEAVEVGWVIVRDICNMFFVLIFLAVAFATILRIESYNAKRILPKLIIMAILINFSRTIFGVIIDFSQVIMLTFAHGFDNGYGWFIKAFNTQNIVSINVKDIQSGEYLTTWATSVGIIAGVVAGIITLIVVVVILAVLVMRIIMLWIYTILSPLVFLGFAFPPLQKYVGRIWEDFIKQVIVGPVLVFFVWLALTTATISSDKLRAGGNKVLTDEVCATVNKFFCEGNFQQFIIMIGLLMGGLMVAQQMGGAAGSIAGKGMNWAKKGAFLPAKGGKALAGFGVDKLQEKTAVDLNAKRIWAGIKTRRAEKKQERYLAGQQKASEVMAEKGRLWGALAMTGAPADAWDQITSRKGIMQRLRGGKRMASNKEKYEGLLDQAKFKENFIGLSKKEQNKIVASLTSESGDLHKKIKTETNKDKVGEYKKRKESIDRKLKFASEEATTTRSEDKTKEMQKTLSKERKAYEKRLSGNIPMYSFEARSAEQKIVNEKAAKIKDITDGGELIRILDDAIREKDKAMIKAITKKMAQNGDDNEYLHKYAKRTDAKGLQIFMQKLRDEVGFGEQEAFALGSEISSINKGTNHWAATNAYKMENGQWKETNTQEQNAYRSGETGKMHIQSLLRNLNRLAYGYHDEEGKFHLDGGGVKLIQKFDNEGAIKMIQGGNLNESAALNIAPYIDKLREQNAISESLANALKERVKSLEERNSESSSQSAAEILKNIGES